MKKLRIFLARLILPKSHHVKRMPGPRWKKPVLEPYVTMKFEGDNEVNTLIGDQSHRKEVYKDARQEENRKEKDQEEGSQETEGDPGQYGLRSLGVVPDGRHEP